jgi:ribokinase
MHAANALKRPTVVIAGSANMDLVVKTHRIPAPGETVLGGTLYQLPGGKGANQAVAAARLGAHVVFIGCVGADAFGSALKANLEAEGVDCRFLQCIEGTATGVALISVDEQGRNSILVAPGANACVTREHLAQAEAAIAGADICIAQLEIPVEAAEEMFAKARKHRVTTLLNPAPFRSAHELQRLLTLSDILTPNEYEAAGILGINATPDLDFEAISEALLNTGPERVIITLGAAGSISLQEGVGPIYQAGFTVTAADTTAAGDCFTGALAASIGSGAKIEEALRFASAAAAISVTRLGAQPSMPYLTEVTELLNAARL